MIGWHDIIYNGNVVGNGLIEKQGLYYQISCKCQAPEKDILCLWLVTEKQEIRLGVYVPGMTVRTAVKPIEIGKCHFELRKRDMPVDLYFTDDLVKVFPLLNQLPYLRTRKANGKLGVVITKAPDQD